MGQARYGTNFWGEWRLTTPIPCFTESLTAITACGIWRRSDIAPASSYSFTSYLNNAMRYFVGGVSVKLHLRDVVSALRGVHPMGETRRDASWKFKGDKNPGSTNLITKFGQLIVRKIINIIATSCHILRLKCTKFDFWRLSVCDLDGVWHFTVRYLSRDVIKQIAERVAKLCSVTMVNVVEIFAVRWIVSVTAFIWQQKKTNKDSITRLKT